MKKHVQPSGTATAQPGASLRSRRTYGGLGTSSPARPGPLKRLLDVSTDDLSNALPDDARRGKLLNILLLGLSLLAILAVIGAGVYGVRGVPVGAKLVPAALLLLAASAIIFIMHRLGGPRLRSVCRWLFVAALSLVLVLTDEPAMLVEGRSAFVILIPVTVASVLLPPGATFAAAGLTSALAIYQALSNGLVPNIFPVLGAFAVALVSWLSARALDRALGELRSMNAELDRRVADRTRQLTEANRELADANERLKELDRVKSRFVSMVSHELRTPLGAIMGFSEMLDKAVYGPVTERQHQVLLRVSRNTERLLTLVTDLLDQARIEAGEMTLRPSPFSPHDLIGDIAATMLMAAEERGLSLVTEVAPDVPDPLYGDARRLHQVLFNLINNAIKFTESGEVRVRVFMPAEQPGAGQSWAVSVSDTGRGIAPEAQSTIFEPFHQLTPPPPTHLEDTAPVEAAHPSDTVPVSQSPLPGIHEGARYPRGDTVPSPEGETVPSPAKYVRSFGTGLGLSIVRELVKLMRGEIRLESEIGKGSTFIVTFPLEE